MFVNVERKKHWFIVFVDYCSITLYLRNPFSSGKVNTMSNTVKLRTMETAYQAIKEMDPETAITRWAIRQAVTGGYIPSRRVGSKYLFNLDTLLDYFNVKAS